jgi:4-amino-4-deoxy-L-arabinose transferase-like glycosyltransferase
MTTVPRRWLPVVTLALLALAATVTTLGHDFTYDDRDIIFINDRVHSLAHLPHLFIETYWPAKYGGDGYRPIVMSLFTLQWVAANGAPWIFHLVNILLAVATTLAVYWCAAAVLPTLGAWVAAALFAVHPVHVEVTGNVVGQSELIVALCLALAVGLYLRRRKTHELTGRDVAAISALFGLGLFTKEHAIVLPGLLVAAEATVLPGDEWRSRVRTMRPLLLALTAVALAYLYVRGLVQQDLVGFLEYPMFRFLRMSAIDRIGTMMNEMPRIAQLILFPTRLSADYSPNDVLVANGPALSQIPGLFICFGTALLAFALRTRAPVVSFGLLWLIIAFFPVSNLLMPAGFVTAERTLFFPSIGAVLMAGALAEHVRLHASVSRRRFATAGLAVLLVAGLARSIDRQRVWKNNDTFFVALMHDAPNGYRAHFIHAKHVGLKGRLSEMEMEYRRAINIFPFDAGMTLAVADAYTRAGLCAPAVVLFELTFGVEPETGEGRYEYVWCLARLGRWSDVRREALDGLRLVQPSEVRLMRAAVVEANKALRK